LEVVAWFRLSGQQWAATPSSAVCSAPLWIEPDAPQHFKVLFEEEHLLNVNKRSGLPTIPGIVLFAKTPQAASCPFVARGLANFANPDILQIGATESKGNISCRPAT